MLQKIYWSEIEPLIATIDSEFCRLVNDIDPSNEYPLYRSCYHYGETIGDNLGTLLKNKKNQSYHLGDPETPTDIVKYLGYGVKNSPLMMILEKKFEWYIFDKKNHISFPIYLEGPGFVIGSRQLLAKGKANTYISSSMMSCTAGTRSAFMLSNIGNQKNHLALQRQLNIVNSPPKTMQEHWQIFKDIYSVTQPDTWQAQLLFFSEPWVESLKSHPKWIYLQRYLIEKMIANWEHDKNHFFYNFAFSRAHTQKNIIKNPYLNATAKHILGIALGANLGFKPSTNEDALPLQAIQKAYRDIYQLKPHAIVLEPAKFDIDAKELQPIYYSLQRPILCSLEEPTKTEPRALVNLHLLSRMLAKYLEAFSSEEGRDYYAGTALHAIAEKIQFSYYHHSPKKIDIPIQAAIAIAKEDQRFSLHAEDPISQDFPSDAKFFRGCIKINRFDK